MFIAFGAAWLTGLIAIFKTKKISICLALHLFFSAFIGAVLVWKIHAPIFMQTLIITFYNVLFIQSVLSATAEKVKDSLPDLLVPLSCLLYFIFLEYFSAAIKSHPKKSCRFGEAFHSLTAAFVREKRTRKSASLFCKLAVFLSGAICAA